MWNGNLWIFGGKAPSKPDNDVWVYDTGAFLEPVFLQTALPPPISRFSNCELLTFAFPFQPSNRGPSTM
jgi:hypothetical protein